MWYSEYPVTFHRLRSVPYIIWSVCLWFLFACIRTLFTCTHSNSFAHKIGVAKMSKFRITWLEEGSFPACGAWVHGEVPFRREFYSCSGFSISVKVTECMHAQMLIHVNSSFKLLLIIMKLQGMKKAVYITHFRPAKIWKMRNATRSSQNSFCQMESSQHLNLYSQSQSWNPLRLKTKIQKPQGWPT